MENLRILREREREVVGSKVDIVLMFLNLFGDRLGSLGQNEGAPGSIKDYFPKRFL